MTSNDVYRKKYIMYDESENSHPNFEKDFKSLYQKYAIAESKRLGDIFHKKYIMYKQKYLKLKELIGGMIPRLLNIPKDHRNTLEEELCERERIDQINNERIILLYETGPNIIRIDNIFFKVVCKIISPCSANDREQYLILSSPNDTFNADSIKFFVYRSISEMDCLRLVFRDKCDVYNKGYGDYVQRTFIHLRLQQFIYEVQDLPVLPMGITFYYEIANNINIIKHINDASRTINTITPFNYYKNSSGAAISGCGLTDNETRIKMGLAILSANIEAKYQIESTTPLFTYNVNVPNKRFCLNIFQTILNEKLNVANKVILYHMKYTISSFKKTIKPALQGRIPLFITTNTNITPYGIYTKFIISGYYICKVFDYSTQCDPTLSSNIHKCNTKMYTYIGDRYNNLFPLNRL